MKALGFTEVSLKEIVEYVKTHATDTESIMDTIFSSHVPAFRFSDKYIIKYLKVAESLALSKLFLHETEAQRELYSLHPKIYGIACDPKSAESYVAMQNYNTVKELSQLEVKIGRFGFLPSFTDRKQSNKLRRANEFGVLNQEYRICVLQRLDMHGADVSQVKRDAGEKVPFSVDDLSLFFYLTQGETEAGKRAFLLETLDFFIAKTDRLRWLFQERADEIGIMVTSASLIFLVDFKRETRDLKLIDFGGSLPTSKTSLWLDENVDALKAVVAELTRVKSLLLKEQN